MNNTTIVYVSYDGMGDQLGQSQVLPYIEGLAQRGYQFELLSFEKPPSNQSFRGLSAHRVHSTRLRYHQRPRVPATIMDITQGALATSILGQISKAQFVHARSYVAATAALPYCRISRTPLLFDMRGLWPDERVDCGSWTADGMIDRSLRYAEKMLLQNSASITVLTNNMASHLRHSRPYNIPSKIHVIPTCVDLELFRTDIRPNSEIQRQVSGTFPLVYLGAVSRRNLIDQMVRFYRHWRRVATPSRLMVITRDNIEPIRQALRPFSLENELIHHSLNRPEVPAAIKCGYAGLFLYRGTIGTIGISPTKLGEFLASGLPVVGNMVGDSKQLLDGETGVLLKDLSEGSMAKGAEKLFALAQHPETQGHCRARAEQWFSLSKGIDAYEQVYQDILQSFQRQNDSWWPRNFRTT
ncbi:MAG: glycosyltransferase [Myxococcales bacterium]|nr:glycosyltransferase [Myxococcales bacterium]